jgi:hypothetical protein
LHECLGVANSEIFDALKSAKEVTSAKSVACKRQRCLPLQPEAEDAENAAPRKNPAGDFIQWLR